MILGSDLLFALATSDWWELSATKTQAETNRITLRNRLLEFLSPKSDSDTHRVDLGHGRARHAFPFYKAASDLIDFSDLVARDDLRAFGSNLTKIESGTGG